MLGIEENGKIVPKIKISENTEKITNPSFKKVCRFYSKETGFAVADVIMLKDEIVPEDEYEIFDPNSTWKRKTLRNYEVRELGVKIFEGGKLIYKVPELKEIAEYSKKELATIWEEVKRLNNPQKYYVDLSSSLFELKKNLLNERR